MGSNIKYSLLSGALGQGTKGCSNGPVIHTCDSTAGSRKIPFIKPVCRSTVPVDQTTVFENFGKYYENPIKSV